MRIVTFVLLIFTFSIGYSQTLPIDFETGVTTSNFIDFDGGVATVLPNPQSNGINSSATVAQIVRSGGQIWAGSKIDLPANLDFSSEGFISMKVFTAAPVGTVVKFKLEGAGSTERDALTTVSNAWEVLTWDFTGTPPNYNSLVFMFDFGNIGDGSANSTFLFDDIEQFAGSGTGLTQIDLPVTFEDTTVDYTTTDFGGNVSSLVVDPTDPNNMVIQAIKTDQATTWAGTTIGTPAGFATNIPLTLSDSKMTVRVWSPTANTPIRLKVEDFTDPTHTCETETNTTIAGGWETLEFDFANEAPGTAQLSTGLSMGWTYNMASIFFNFGTDGLTAGEQTYYFDDVQFGSGGTGGGLSQIDLPVTFEDTTVDYTTTDFGGNVSSVVVDPTDPNNMVAQVIKTDQAATWAGTNIGTPAGFASNIPFTQSDSKMTVRVWSPTANTPIRLKVEDSNDPTRTCETEINTIMAGAWETLEFDFANEVPGTAQLSTGLSMGWTYNMASIFFNFGTDGATAGEQTYYFDDVEFVPGGTGGNLAQIDLPVTFEDTTVDYTTTDFGGNVSSHVVDPTDPNNMVAQVIKTDQAATWAGTNIGTPAGFASNIPFTLSDSKMTVRVWSPTANTPIRLKVEDSNDPTRTCETEINTTMAGAWETLEFDFANEVPGTAQLSTGLSMGWTYNMASIFFNFGTDGATAGEQTYYFDDVEFVPGGTGGNLAQIDLPVTFEDTTVDYTTTDFGGNVSSHVVDPTDPNNMVAQVVKTDQAATWAGTTIGTPAGFASNIPFTQSDSKMTVRVWSPTANTPIRLKVEDSNDPTRTCETEINTTMAGAWETLEFDFANEVPGTAQLSTGLSMGWTYNMASIFFNFGTDGATAGEQTYYFDDVEFMPGGTGGNLAQIDLPVTFEDTTVDYTTTDFGGNVSSHVVDPTDPNNMVAQVIKTDMAETWAGTTIGTPAGFASNIPFTQSESKMTVRVWSPTANTPIRLKVEDSNDPTRTCETEINTTMAGAWETLEFDFANEVPGTAQLSTGLSMGWTYNMASIFFNFGTGGATAGEQTYYFDDVEFGGSGTGGNLAQIDLPVTFEDTTVDYTTTDFGGNVSSHVVDPTDPNNMVAQVIKTDMAETWAGTTIGTPAGFASNIPFTQSESKMTVRVWSPTANTPIRLKVEDSNDPTRTCETEINTTMAGAWETLEFDFANEVPGTAQLSTGLSMGWTYNMASIFFNFGTDGATAGEQTYYFDDVQFGELISSISIPEIEGLEVYPNPSADQWHISSKHTPIASVEIFDIQGKQLISLAPQNLMAHIDASGLPKGVYIAKISTHSASSIVRLVRE